MKKKLTFISAWPLNSSNTATASCFRRVKNCGPTGWGRFFAGDFKKHFGYAPSIL